MITMFSGKIYKVLDMYIIKCLFNLLAKSVITFKIENAQRILGAIFCNIPLVYYQSKWERLEEAA